MLEQRAGEQADEQAALLSLHFYEAGDHERAWRYGVIAGERAEASFANVIAAELFERALAAAEHLDDVGATERRACYEQLGDVCERFAAYDQACNGLREGAGARPRRPDRRHAADRQDRHGATSARGATTTRSRRTRRASPGSRTSTARTRAEIRARINIGQAGIRYRQTRYEESIAAALSAIEHAERGRESRAASRTPCYILDAAYTDLGTAGRAALSRAGAADLRGAARLPRPGRSCSTTSASTPTTRAAGTSRSSFYRQSRAAKELVGDVIGAAVQMNNEAEILSDQGHLDEALPLFDDWLRACRASGYAFGVGVALSNLGRVAARGSHFADAYGLFEDALDQFAQLSSERFANETRARMAECLVIEGSHGRALELGLACREAAARSPVGGLEALIERTIGYALCQGRRRDEATPHFEESLQPRARAEGGVRGRR